MIFKCLIYLIVLLIYCCKSNYAGEILTLDENATDFDNLNSTSNITGRFLSLNSFISLTKQVGNLFLNSNKKTESNQPANIKNINNSLSNSLYSFSDNVFGNNITKLIAPLVKPMLANNNHNIENTKKNDPNNNTDETDKKDTLLEIDLDGLKIMNNFPVLNFGISKVNDSLKCRTHSQDDGVCLSLSHCPTLIFNIDNFRKSICFANPVTPGVCCPKNLIIYNYTNTNTNTNTNANSNIQFNGNNIQPSNTNLPSENYKNDIIDVNDCGLETTNSFRIVGGEDSFNNQWPWIAAIYIVDNNRKPKKYCGGTIIHPKFIMTAGHCTENKRGTRYPSGRYLVRVGVTDLDSATGYWYKASKVILHERYLRRDFLNDIALIKLSKPIEKKTNSVPICLPKEDVPDHVLYQKQSTILGWGDTAHGGSEATNLKHAVVPIWSNDECSQQMSYTSITSNQFCAGYYEGGIDACQGDSGGPLIINFGGRWVQMGVISYGVECAKAYKPGVYTKVSRYRSWIEKKIQDIF